MTNTRRVLMTLAAAAWAGLLVFSPAIASASTTWTVTSTPVNDGVTLYSVSCTASSRCMAVGVSSNTGASIVYLWNGSTWVATPAPADSYLAGVACPTTTYCIAVGSNGNGLAQAWSWNSSNWTELTTYHTKSNSSELVAIKCAGPSSCEAVGSKENFEGSSSNPYPLAEYWNGSTFSPQSTMGAPYGYLSDVSCAYGGHCEAVGGLCDDCPVGGYGGPLAMSLSGTTWTTQSMPKELRQQSGWLSGISCYSTGCTAVGLLTNYSTGRDKTLAEVWNGKTWALQSPVGSGDPPHRAGAYWNDVHCQSASSCTAIGGSETYTLASTWSGGTWTTNSTPSPGTNNELRALSCTSSGLICTAVGDQSSGSLAERN